LQLPHDGDGNQGEEEVGGDVDGRVENADVLEDVRVVAFRVPAESESVSWFLSCAGTYVDQCAGSDRSTDRHARFAGKMLRVSTAHSF